MEQPAVGFGGDALRADIRLLGRVPGDTIRAQQGEATFDVVENVRRMSVTSKALQDQCEPGRHCGRARRRAILRQCTRRD
jgi:hypothetical protein